ncbi:hypothetical protein OOU_Y34scaffold00911g3 [Pyricularia oryzae Y34]|uniref:Uncharacterized protein n=2 Tax=Pyricularia oryzae TaxID=318829 RepID=A0AA97NP37_PYRO3|nr:hypothetical protein OOU_Y34scaffold00911g3 [Pyricularia oryzae Y34]
MANGWPEPKRFEEPTAAALSTTKDSGADSQTQST